MKNMEVRDWAALEDDVVGVILEQIVSLYDYLQFSLVCKSWYFIALSFKHERSIISSKFPQLPMLIVPSNSLLQSQHHHSLYDLRTNNIRPVHFKFPFDKRCCGSSFGWLIMLEKSLHVSLFNPFSGAHISLPPINVEPDPPNVYFSTGIFKAILTKDPSLYSNDYMVVAIYTSFNKLCLLRANDRTWIYQNPQLQYYFLDVNLCHDTLYAICQDMILWKIEIDESASIFVKAITSELNLDVEMSDWRSFVVSYSRSVYVVESSKKEVLLIKRLFSIKYENEEEEFLKILYVKTGKFLIYKLSDECNEDGIRRVTKVENLDGDVIFIGDNQSICVPSKHFSKCPPNRIYYTENCYEFATPFIYGPQDAGVYNLEDKSFDRHYRTNPIHRNLPPPIWIVPTICFKDFKD